MKNKTYDVIVVGGGPAGMMAAGRAGKLGMKVLLLEKNISLGKKLTLTGGRRCNITNAEFDNRIFLDNFVEAKQFLFSPFSQFNVQSTFDFFESRGLSLVIEDRKRAFPKSENAEDVLLVLEKYIAESKNVIIKFDSTVRSFIVEGNIIKGVRVADKSYYARNIVLATGGLAAPETGSTGDGLAMLETIGHKIKKPNSNLTPLRTATRWVKNLSGTTVDDVVIHYKQNNKTKIKLRGRILFTHFGISGPLVINSAYKVKKLLEKGEVVASIDLFPDYDLGSLDKMILDFFEKNKNKLVKTVLKELIKNRVSETILKFSGLNIAELPVHSLSRDQRKLLVRTLKNLSFLITGLMGFNWSIVADGGVVPEEVDFRTMKSKLFSNLYLVGDTLDINRPSGGFSLQLCWTSGWIAGTDTAHKLESNL